MTVWAASPGEAAAASHAAVDRVDALLTADVGAGDLATARGVLGLLSELEPAPPAP